MASTEHRGEHGPSGNETEQADTQQADTQQADSEQATARLAELIAASGSVVALTGAGISVPSSIPDFRSADSGLWEQVDPMTVATIDAFHRDPAVFWEFYRPRLSMLARTEPNPAHDALAELERRGHCDAVITQNIDELHRRAGTREPIHVHGSAATASCLACGAGFRALEVEELFDERGIARCRHCAGAVKPDVVLFGELLPVEAIWRAQRLAAGADLLLCVGTSLEVYPVAELPELTAAGGGSVAIVTASDTGYDDIAAVRLRGDVAELLPAVVAAL